MDTGSEQMEAWAQAQLVRIHSAALNAMTEIGGLAVDSLVERLNTPFPPASIEGEDPHRRSGLLSAGVSFTVEDLEDQITTYIISDREGSGNIPLWLDEGTSRGLAPRRYFQRTREEWEQKLEPTFEELFWGNMA